MLRLIRPYVYLLSLSLFLSGCRELALQPETPVASMTTSPDASPSPTRVLDPTSTPTPPPTPTSTPTPANIWIEPSGVRVYPASGLYSGDTLSFEIEAHNGSDEDRSNVPVVVDWGTGSADGRIYLPRGGSGSTDLLWVWDTGSLVGTQTITVTIDPENETGDPDPDNNVAVINVDLSPDLPANEVGAEWQTVTSDCCTFRFISDTAAARDIDAIARIADEAMAFVEDRLDVRRRDRLEVYLIDRVLGHGGFAGDAITISYLDRNYAGGGLLEVFRHEATHMLDRHIAEGEQPALLVEGFAVYITGGHFKIEPLPERVAALLQDGDYIPLRDLANDFYPSQHETGYLEGGAFIDYLVQRDGYDTFVELYDGMKRQPDESDADMLDREMRTVYGIGLDELEAEWLATLRTLDVGDQRRDVANTIAFYDTVRRYQRALDPSAYFLSAWIPDIGQAQSRGLVADYLRHPRAAENIALETILVAADEALAAHDFERGEALLASVNAVLDAGIEFADPLAARYYDIVRAALEAGYEPQRITLDGDQADVWAQQGGDAALLRLSAERQDDAWAVQLSR
jgi:hypothetical protein